MSDITDAQQVQVYGSNSNNRVALQGTLWKIRPQFVPSHTLILTYNLATMPDIFKGFHKCH